MLRVVKSSSLAQPFKIQLSFKTSHITNQVIKNTCSNLNLQNCSFLKQTYSIIQTQKYFISQRIHCRFSTSDNQYQRAQKSSQFKKKYERSNSSSNNRKQYQTETNKYDKQAAPELFPQMNYYQIIGLQKNYINPTQEEIKTAYLEAVKKYHPDLSTDKLAAQKFQIIQKVYQVLSDPQKRSQYRASLNIPIEEEQTYEAAARFKQQYKDYDKVIKQRVPDQWQFSYKLYKQHYQNVEVPKKNYTKYHGQDQQYWVHKDQIPISSKSIIQAVSMIAGSVLIGSCALYYAWK